MLLATTFRATAGQVPDTMQQRLKACTSCHGEHGRGGDNGFNPRLAGRPALYLYRQMLAFRDGDRDYPLMRHMVRGVPDAYLHEIAEYFSAQHPPAPHGESVALPDTARSEAKRLVEQGDLARGVPACIACHGRHLTGRQPGIPGLSGLSRDYIRNQLGAWRNGSRHATHPDCMADVASRLSSREITLVSTWLASQAIPEHAQPAAAGSASLPLTCGSTRAYHGPAEPADNKHVDAQVARGRYLARIGDCASCHTAEGGKPLAGGRPIPTPFGTIYTTNITPDRATGIGAWSDGDFYRAMHEGIDAQGNYLYPAFPFTSFTRLTRKDVDAIHAWLRTVQPVHRKNTPDTLSFPYRMRSLMALWRTLYFKQGTWKPDPDKSAQWNRGAYLVNGLGHCADCHTPRNWLGAVNSGESFAGAMIPGQHWYAPNLGTAKGNGLHGWSRSELVDYLHTGRSARGIAYGPMAEVVQGSLQYLTDSDVQAMAVYLLDRSSHPTPRGASGSHLPPPIRKARARHQRSVEIRGRAVYRKHCAACHGKHGRGHRGIYPALAGNTSLLSTSAANAIRKVLLGGFAPATRTWPRPYSMPPFIQKLSDREVADVVTYLRHAWGNRPATDVPYATVSADTVAGYRSTFSH